MAHVSMEHLPAMLQDALRAEVDPDETVRWCGQPLASRAFRDAWPLTLLALIVLTFIAAGIGALAYRTTWEVTHAAPERPSPPSSVVAAVILSAVVGTCAIAAFTLPWHARRRARRTVYAVTTTRVFILRRHPSGRVNVDLIEPGHPLRITRCDHGDGSGSVSIHAGAPLSNLVLAAVTEPREVERLIRHTFDPPAAGRGAAPPDSGSR
ncbi:MAG: hypothetical protein ACKVU4_02260 [Phycisphaerales bacterium]